MSWKTAMGSRMKAPTTQEEMVSDLLHHLDIHESMEVESGKEAWGRSHCSPKLAEMRLQ